MKSADAIGWRDFFADPRLQSLIDIALRNNRDLRVAALNVAAAQAQYRVQRADLFPQTSASSTGELGSLPASATIPTGKRWNERSGRSKRGLDRSTESFMPPEFRAAVWCN